MNIDGKPFRTIFLAEDKWRVFIIDQTQLPHEFKTLGLESLEQAAQAITKMQVRGAPLIGATAAYGVALAMRGDPSDEMLSHAYKTLLGTRPTAVNLRWALDTMEGVLLPLPPSERQAAAYKHAAALCNEDVEICSAIGDHGANVIEDLWQQKGKEGFVNVLTHCNAGWLATVDWGTALAPIYKAHDKGIPVHVWVDETRPRNQGFNLTAWELRHHGVPHTIIVDNVGGHLMQHGQVDLCIVGTDRTTRTGDVCNKIGTYLKALAAKDNEVPFYVALPSPTIDWAMRDGLSEIPIEQRCGSEVTHVTGRTEDGSVQTICISPEGSVAANYGFDVTPARLITGLITERGITLATEKGLAQIFPDEANIR